MPYVGNAQMFFYDAAKFAEQGVADGPKTWDDVLKAGNGADQSRRRPLFRLCVPRRPGQSGGRRLHADLLVLRRRPVQCRPVEGDDRHARGRGRDEDLHGAPRRLAERCRELQRQRSRPGAGRRHRCLVDQLAELGRDVRRPEPVEDGRQDLLLGNSRRHHAGARRSAIGPWASCRLPRTSRKPSTSWCGRPRRSRSRFPPSAAIRRSASRYSPIRN